MSRSGSWIRKSTRLAIYMRDRFVCHYCLGSFWGRLHALTLDHIRPTAKGGTHAPVNLVTACLSCNSAKRQRAVRQFAGADAVRLVRNARRRQLPRRVSRALLRAPARNDPAPLARATHASPPENLGALVAALEKRLAGR